jgi:hypothetical protein
MVTVVLAVSKLVVSHVNMSGSIVRQTAAACPPA